jgi:hypothetical protein
MKIRIFFAWYDFWIGLYWDRKDYSLYVCLIPTIVIRIWNEKITKERIWNQILEEPYG